MVESGQSSEDPVHLLRIGRAAIYLGDDRAVLTLHARAVDISRRTGAISLLPVALERFAFANLLAGRLADAAVAVPRDSGLPMTWAKTSSQPTIW